MRRFWLSYPEPNQALEPTASRCDVKVVSKEWS
jgi:hypothetical protein